MRRDIGVLNTNKHRLTSYVMIDSLFSPLPLPTANGFMGKDLCRIKKIETTDHTSVPSVVKKNIRR
jgi:hypothetical protein